MMKNSLSCLILFLVLTMIFGGCDVERNDDILASKIQYDVPIFSVNPQLDWWINNLEGSKRDPFVKRIMEAAERGEVKAYDYFNKPLSPREVISMKMDTVYRTLTRNYPPYEEYDTVVYFELDYRDITKIRFLEEWRWDPETLEMEKEVLGIAPVVVIEYEGQEYNRPLYWIYLEELRIKN